MEATLLPTTLAEALEAKAAHPEAVPIAGGTDLMVDLNFDRRRPERLIDLTRIPELGEWWRDEGTLVLGSGVTFARVVAELPETAPGLALASRTVGSPQIRNRGTLGGNLGTSSPAGDALPPLVAGDAEVEVRSVRGARRVPAADFALSPRRNVLQEDELITAVRLPLPRGPEQFAKVGPRNAMVIAVCSFALSLDPEARRVGTGIGSAAPTVIRAPEAERFLEGALEEAGLWAPPGALPEAVRTRFGELVGAAARPIDDLRGSAEYRRHALSVLARRTLAWAWDGARP
jgi:CO/xanthine dehydrogenase FAD-binding subunit